MNNYPVIITTSNKTLSRIRGAVGKEEGKQGIDWIGVKEREHFMSRLNEDLECKVTRFRLSAQIKGCSKVR